MYLNHEHMCNGCSEAHRTWQDASYLRYGISTKKKTIVMNWFTNNHNRNEYYTTERDAMLFTLVITDLAGRAPWWGRVANIEVNEWSRSQSTVWWIDMYLTHVHTCNGCSNHTERDKMQASYVMASALKENNWHELIHQQQTATMNTIKLNESQCTLH